MLLCWRVFKFEGDEAKQVNLLQQAAVNRSLRSKRACSAGERGAAQQLQAFVCTLCIHKTRRIEGLLSVPAAALRPLGWRAPNSGGRELGRGGLPCILAQTLSCCAAAASWMVLTRAARMPCGWSGVGLVLEVGFIC